MTPTRPLSALAANPPRPQHRAAGRTGGAGAQVQGPSPGGQRLHTPGTLTPEAEWLRTLTGPHPPHVPRALEQQQRDTPAASPGAASWTRVRRAIARERRVRFLLEPTEAAAAPASEAEGPPEGPVWLCSNSRLPAVLPSGPPAPGELQQLERRIQSARERLRQALVRRGELLAQLGDGPCDRPLRLLQAPEVAR